MTDLVHDLFETIPSTNDIDLTKPTNVALNRMYVPTISVHRYE